MWHPACGTQGDLKGSSTSKSKGIRRHADMKSWHSKVMSAVNLAGAPL